MIHFFEWLDEAIPDRVLYPMCATVSLVGLTIFIVSIVMNHGCFPR